MTINLIGSGNVAFNLANSLINRGHNLLSVYSRTFSNALLVAKEFDTVAVESIKDLSEMADITIISVTDDAIKNISEELELNNVVHTSGSVGIEALSKHGSYGVFYPLQTFSKKRIISFNSIPLCLEGSDSTILNKMSLLANSLSGNVYYLDSEKRKILHVSAVFACNFVNHFYSLSEHILKENYISFDIIRPLIEETAHKAIANSPVKVQTGPAARGDLDTINKHLRTLEKNSYLHDIYKFVSDSIISGSREIKK